METGVLTIAGLDPSGGAGLLADIKVFERFQTLGFAVATAITFQNEEKGLGVSWVSLEVIKKQLDPLFESHEIRVVKIGVIENLNVLYGLLHYLKHDHQVETIIWDPVIKASSGLVFLKELPKKELASVLKEVDVITPNLEEAFQLSKALGMTKVRELSSCCHMLLKGGHAEGEEVIDVLYQMDGTRYPIVHERLVGVNKRGTGCAFSAALAACMFLGDPLVDAFEEANAYVFQLLQSSESKLGHHFMVTP